MGDVAVTWVLWRRDDEFPVEGSILLDRGVTGHLPAEDIVVSCRTMALKPCFAGARFATVL